MKITIVENKEHGFANLKFSDKPDYVKDKALLDELKANGWGYSKYNGVWYPRTNEAKNKANDFAKEIVEKYSEPAKSFGQELFERSQRIDEWKKNNLNVEENPVQSTSQDHSTNEPVSQPVQNIELNDKQKQVLDLLKSAGNLSESQMLEIVSKIDQAYQSKNFEPAQKRIPKELSWEELKEFIHADDSFDLSKDLRELYHPTESETYQKIMATYNHFHDIMNWDVLRETSYERSADSEFHNSMESIRKNILWDTCEKTVNGFFNTFEDFQNYFKTLRDNEIYNISKNYMENPEIKAMYKEMKRAELSERVPESLKGREFSSWLIPNPEQDGAFLFYESNGYLKSEYLNQNKYESVKNFLAEVESDELLTDSAKQLKTEYAKMHGLLKTPAEEIKADIEADKLDDLMTELVEEELYQNNQLEIESIESDESNENTTSKWLNEEDLEYVEYPGNKEKTEEKSIELTEEDLEYAQKVIPEEQYMDMLQYANGEEAEHFKAKLKNAANIARELMNRKSSKELLNADGSHPCKLHYFIGGCDWYISELDKDGVGFGYAILNNDLTFSEWGSVNVCGDSTYEQPLTKMSVSVPVEINGREFRNSLTPQLDLYLDEDTTIERELYKRDNEFFNEYEKYAKIEKNNEKELAKSSEVSINIIEETNQDLEAQYGSEIDNGLVGRADSSSGSNLTQELEGQGESRNRGDNSGARQRVLSGEREGNSELGHTEGVPGIEQSRPESRFNNIPGKEGLSGSNETLFSEVGIGESNSDMQSAGMADNSTLHRSSSEQSELRVGVNQNESVSDDPLQGTTDTEISENRIELTPDQWKALTSLALNSNASWWIENPKNIGKERYSVPKKDIEDLCAVKLQDFVTQNDLNIINELLEQNNIHYQTLTIHVNQNQNIEQNPEQNIEKEADKYFDEITNRYSNQYAEFFKNYNDVKEAHLENETRYVGDARIRSLFENTHKELVNLQFEELTDIIKNAKNLEIAKNAATRYFNFAGQDEFNYLHDNLFLRCHLGDYVRNELGTTSFVAPKPEELQNFITETFNSLHGITQEVSKPVFNFFVKDTAEFEQFEDFEPITNLTADEAINEYIKKYNEGLFAGIGINMPGDLVFDDPNGEGAYILLRKENVDTFKIMGDTFITELKEANERSEKYIKAYEELYDAALAHGLNVERPDFLFKKTYELYHKPSLEFDFDVDDLFENIPVDDKEYAENLADWIIQHGMNESTEMENYSVSFEDILENTDTTEEWLNAHIDLINDALAAHNDNELLEYNPDENEGKEFNLYFCSNSDEMGENTLFKQNEEGRWIRKSEEELQQEKEERIKATEMPDNPQHTLSWEELELDPNEYDAYGDVPSDETEFKEWALGLQLENELDLRGFDTGLENVSNEDNSRISEEKWAILDNLSHRIVYGELKYEPHNYDYSNQQKEYDRLLKENPVFQELTSNGVIKADFTNPFVVSAEEKKEPLTMLKAEDVKFSRESKDQMYSYDGIDGTWYITDKVIDINSNIITYQLAFKTKPEERTFSSEMARNNWLGITEIPSDNYVTKNHKQYYIFTDDKETFRIKELTEYIPYGNIFRNSKACRDEAVNWVVQEENKKRTGCRDVFHAYFVEDAEFDGKWEIPFIDSETDIPNRIISFSKALRTDDYNQWVHFYEDDVNFERLWNRPSVYLPKLQKFKGVISPDFSLYRDMPLIMQAWNTYRNRATGHWLQSNGIRVIPNIRWADSRSYEFCFAGARKNSVIAVGTHGLIKIKEERKYFERGLEQAVEILQPKTIVIYGAAPKDIFQKYEDEGIVLIHFSSDISIFMKRGDA